MNPFLRISEIMSIRLVTVHPGTSVTEAAGRMRGEGVGSVIVCDGPRLAGIVTERDLVTAVAEGRDLGHTPVDAIMTSSVITVDPESDIVYAARTMAERSIRHLPVAEEDRVIGIISIRDIVRWGLMALAWDAANEEARAAFELLGTRSRPVTTGAG